MLQKTVADDEQFEMQAPGNAEASSSQQKSVESAYDPGIEAPLLMRALCRIVEGGSLDALGAGAKERHFQAALFPLLAEEVATDRPRATVVQELNPTLDDFPGVGKVDLAVLREPRPSQPAKAESFVELKWGEGTLWNCVWDAAKLALAIRVKRARTGFIVAGAPQGAWAKPERGAELFGEGTWDVEDFLREYADVFAFARKTVITRPRRLPSPIVTTRVGTVQLPVGGVPWEIRCAAVTAPGEWSVTLDQDGQVTHRNRADRFTSYDADVDWHPREPGKSGEGEDLATDDEERLIRFINRRSDREATDTD